MKICRECGAEKPLSDYYKHKQMLDGHLNKCKDCVKNRVKKHRQENIERIREYDRNRGSRQNYQYIKEYREKYPNKYKAHNSVNNAIRDGKLTKGGCCENCGDDKNIIGHHDNYLKPLDVRWLCEICHKQWHKDNGEGKNP